MKVNIENERMKRKFSRWLKEAHRCHSSTVDNIEKAIILYEDFTKRTCFKTFNTNRAIEFKEYLRKKEFRGKVISLTTYYTYLRYLKKFFLWLSGQMGYKSKITPDIVDYLNISEKDKRIATQMTPRNYPTLAYVLKLANSIKVYNEIDLRDRALIAFTLLSGMRDTAIITLPLCCLDMEKLTISQNPKMNVQTKFSKYILSTLFKFNEQLLDYVREWVKHIKNKDFGSQDPLFPRAKREQGPDNLSFQASDKVETTFWQGTGSMRGIFKKRAKKASLSYYPPHTFRHLAVSLALKYCKTGEQIKAMSQNFGHEHIATTLSSYANYTPDRLSEILKSMDFSGKPQKTVDDKLDEIMRTIKPNTT